MEKFLKKQFAEFEKNKIVCVSRNLYPQKNSDGSIKYEGDRLKKMMAYYFKSNEYDEGIENEIDLNYNSSLVPMGSKYNLIGIDIDNKGDTLDIWAKINKIVGRSTFTIETMNKGYHYYYRLSDEQKQILKRYNFSQSQGKLYGLSIDVKYEHAFLFGPTFMEVEDKVYKYKVVDDTPPQILPLGIFHEIIKEQQEAEFKSFSKTYLQETEETKKEIKEIKEIKENKEVKNKDDKIKHLLTLLSPKRCDEREEWLKIGAIIYNEKAEFEVFNEWSKRSEKYDKKACEELWKSFNKERNKKITIASLYEMVKEDNPEEFRKLFTNTSSEIINQIYKNGAINDVLCSQLFCSLHKNKFIYDMENKEWYSLNKFGVYERSTNESIEAKKLINKLQPLFEKDYIQRIENKDDDIKKRYSKIYCQIRTYLGKANSKENICNELKLIFSQKKIYEKFDNVNNYLVGFENGVYDLKKREFRNGETSELITCNVGYEFKEKNEVNNEIRDLMKVLNDIFPNEEEKIYMLKAISLGLLGENPLEEIYIWIGSGGNGKGLLRDLIKKSLGDYFDSMEVDYLTKTTFQGSANQADPIMAKKKNSRIVVTTEPEGGVRLKEGKLKQISGRDPVQVRFLNKNPFTFTPKFKLIIQTNDKPEIDGTDKALKRRIRFLRFPTSFVENPQKENERKLDTSLKDKLNENENYKVAFFHILLSYFLMFDNNQYHLEMPERFKNETEEYFNDNDPVQAFLDEKCEITNDDNDRVPSSEFYQIFTKFQTDNGRMNSITVQKFKEILSNKNIQQKKTKKCNVYCFVKLIQEEREDLLDL